MENLLSVFALILIIIWIIGFIALNAGGIIHILLVVALISFILRIIQVRNPN